MQSAATAVRRLSTIARNGRVRQSIPGGGCVGREGARKRYCGSDCRSETAAKPGARFAAMRPFVSTGPLQVDAGPDHEIRARDEEAEALRGRVRKVQNHRPDDIGPGVSSIVTATPRFMQKSRSYLAFVKPPPGDSDVYHLHRSVGRCAYRGHRRRRCTRPTRTARTTDAVRRDAPHITDKAARRRHQRHGPHLVPSSAWRASQPV